VRRPPPAAAALATERIAEEVGEGPGRLLEAGTAGIHAAALALLGWDVTVAEDSDARLARARERAGHVAAVLPLHDVRGPFDVVVAPDESLRSLGTRFVRA
jgi:hypothetical protein